MSEGGEKPKILNRIDNILSILFRLFGFSPPSDIGGFV
jgi:hypothetical protein